MHTFILIYNLTVFPFTGLFLNNIQHGNDPEFAGATFEDNNPTEDDRLTYTFDRTLNFLGTDFGTIYVSEKLAITII